jgi:hypothetical protein
MIAVGGSLYAQMPEVRKVVPKGYFLKDTVKVGEPVSFAFSLKHPANMQVVFPDSAYDFSPFVFVSKEFFPTRTDSLHSTDSAVYTLSTFELDSLPSLALPAYILLPSGDSLERWSEADTVLLFNNIKVAENFLPSTEPQKVMERFNYPYWGIGVAVVLTLLLFLNGVLGKPLNRAFKLLLMKQKHTAFLKAYDKWTVQVTKSPSAANSEKILTLWKKYIEKVDGVPYSTYTTREIAQYLPDEDLQKTLQTIDRFVYGGIAPEQMDKHLQRLRQQAEIIYETKRNQVKKN